MTLVLVNPRAQGGRVQRLLPTLREAAEAMSPFARVQAPDSVEEALHILQREATGARVVVVGGDGSLHRWLPALLTRSLRVGLVPMGSGNDLARALELDRRDWRQALTDALQGQPAPMDTGLAVWTDPGGDVHRTPFASSLTCGFDSAVALRALHGPRWLRGLPRYLWATLSEWRHLRHWMAQIECDGQPRHGERMLFMSVLNTPTYGSGLPAVPHARVDDGQLDWLHAGPFGRWGTLAMLPRLTSGAHLRHPMVQTGRFTQLQLTCNDGLPLAADGEWLGLARQVRITVVPAGLQMVRPPA